MKLKWDISDNGFNPNVGRAIWGDGTSLDYDEPSQNNLNANGYAYNTPRCEGMYPASSSNNDQSGIYRGGSSPYTPRHEKTNTHQRSSSHVYSPQIIYENNRGDWKFNGKNMVYMAISFAIILASIHFITPDLIPMLIHFLQDQLYILQSGM